LRNASGFSGCNTFRAAYELEFSSLRFGPIASTRRACPGQAAEVEAGFLKALQETRSWEIVDTTLSLMDGTDDVLARLTVGRPGGRNADLQSLTVISAVVATGPVKLIGGEYRNSAAPGSASEISIKLTEHHAFGTLNGKEIEAIVLSSSSGGSGSFSELALLVESGKEWENTDTILLGDRVRIHSVTIRENTIVVSMTAHAPGDPMCCPTLETTKTYKIDGNHLVVDDEPEA
jgi:hypothetical protein